VIGLRNRVLRSIGFTANRCRIPPTKLACVRYWKTTWVCKAKLVMLYLYRKCVPVVCIWTPRNFEKRQSIAFSVQFPKIFKCTGMWLSFNSWKLSEMSNCDQSNIAHSDDLPRMLLFEKDVPLSRLSKSDGAQAGSIVSTLQISILQLWERSFLQALCVQVLCPVTLVALEYNNTLVCQNKPCCDLVMRAITWNKPCNPTCVKSLCFYLFVTHAVPQIVRHCKNICPFWANRPHVQNITEIS